MSPNLDQQLQDAERALAEAQAAEAERQGAEREPAARAQAARQQIAVLQGQKRAERTQQLVAEHNQLLRSVNAASESLLNELKASENRLRAFDIGALVGTLRLFTATSKAVADYGNAAYAELQSSGEKPLPGLFRDAPAGWSALLQWYDQTAPNSKESLDRGVLLYKLTGRVEFIDWWHVSLVERARDRMTHRFPNPRR